MKKFFCLAIFCVGVMIALRFTAFAENPPCRPGGPDGGWYRMDKNGVLLLDKNGDKIPVPGYASSKRGYKCCDKKVNPECTSFDCLRPDPRYNVYFHKVTPFPLGKCNKARILDSCKKCYYRDGASEKPNKPACEKDVWYKAPADTYSDACVGSNKYKTTYNYDHSVTGDCF
jgi:hypothetical protein